MLELYYHANSVCVHKVLIVLAEKDLEWQGHLMELKGDQFDPAYLKLNPNANVPTLVHNGYPIIESTVILSYLDEAFPTAPILTPASPRDRARMRMFTKLIDEYVHSSCTVMTLSTAYRAQYQAMPESAREEMLASMPNKQRSLFMRDVIANGLESSYVHNAVQQFNKLLNWIDDSVREHPYLAGDTFSLADAAVYPYILRLDLVRLARMWCDRPRIAEWYDRVRHRPSCQAIRNQMTPSDEAPFKGIKIDPWPAVDRILKA